MHFARTLMLPQVRTKMINSANEQQAAAKCFQNQEKLFLTDVKVRHEQQQFTGVFRDVLSPPYLIA